MIKLQMIEINFIKKAIFFIFRQLFRQLFNKKVRAGLSARGSLNTPFGHKPSLVHFLFYCWSLHPFY